MTSRRSHLATLQKPCPGSPRCTDAPRSPGVAGENTRWSDLRTGSHRIAAGARSRRRGAAAFEFAVCLPVLALLVFGSIEAASVIFLKQSLEIAAHEGAREAVRATASTAEAETAAQAILDSREVQAATVRFPHGDVATVGRGQPVLVEVSTTTRSNSPLAGHFLPNRQLVARAVMVKE